MGLRLTDIFLKTKEELIGIPISFTVKDVEFKENEAIISFVEIPTMVIKVGSKVETKSWSRKKRT
jgi:hypothetical protein